MFYQLIASLVVLVLFWFIQEYAIGNAPLDPKPKWALTAIAVIIAVFIVAGIWGLIPGGNPGWWHECGVGR